MPSNKDRLYIALYHHEREGAYHWAYLVSPKSSPDGANKTTRYHVTNKLLPRDETVKPTWKYEQLPLPKVKTAKLLARILIGKVEKSRKEFENSLKRVPIIQDDPSWRCRTWMINAMAQLVKDNVLGGSSVTQWDLIEAESKAYVKRKVDEGRFNSWTETTPTYDLMTNCEVVK